MDGISAYDSPSIPRGSVNNNGPSTGGKTPRGSAKAALDKQAALELVMGQQAPAFGEEEEASNAEGWSAALPDGWVLLAAPDGTPYYYNEATQESSWTLPQDAAQPPLPPKAGASVGQGPSVPRRTAVGWVGEGGEGNEQVRRQLEATQAELNSLKGQLQSLHRGGDSAHSQEEIERLHTVIRRLRVERSDLEASLEDADRDARAGHKARKELEFARRRLEEVEGELAHATSWEGVLTTVEETLRGSFSKEHHTGDWVVSVDLLQDLVNGVETILGSFRPYLPSSATATEASPPPSAGSDTTKALLQQSQGKCVELEGRIKVLEAQLHMSEQRRVEETAALKDTLHTLSHAVGKAASVPAVAPVSAEAILEVETLRARVAALTRDSDAASARVSVLQEEVESARSKRHKAEAALDSLQTQYTQLQKQLSDRSSSGAEDARALSHKVDSLTTDLEKAHKALRNAEEEQAAQVSKLKKKLSAAEEALADRTSSGADDLKALTSKVQTLTAQVDSLTTELDKAHKALKTAEADTAAQVSKLKKKLLSSEEALHKAQQEAEHAHTQASKAQAHAHQIIGEVDDLKATLEQVRAKSVSDLAAKEASLTATFEALRAKNRTLNERILELQGNIRVLCRVRPMSRRELEANEGGPSMDSLLQYPEEGLLHFHDAKFEYDQVFRPDATQESIFREVQPAVWSSLQGYRVSIFAYGQTGSGKTFTMEGSPDNRGVNYRAINELFTLIAASQATHEYQVKMSMLEVYNESIQDLLGEGRGGKGLDVRVGPKGGVYVEGLTQVDVTAMGDVEALMTMGARNRHVGATNMNEHSSRSHLVITLSVLGANKKTGAKVVGKLNLIDLAGSERLKTTGATGDRLEEAKNINKSLSALGDVIASLASASAHVPYRNSKLTFLLQDSLSPAAKVVMFVNINPAPASASESLCSLNFAARCRSVQLGQAKKGPTAPATPRKTVAAGEEDDRPTTPTTPRK